mmetsp:Transcript_6832/g.18333  ORF Transcript_6832/g.18333 Transcript_6832/m.18333 type:complete len:242 (-) Transcript_6832:587-1312(-)
MPLCDMSLKTEHEIQIRITTLSVSMVSIWVAPSLPTPCRWRCSGPLPFICPIHKFFHSLTPLPALQWELIRSDVWFAHFCQALLQQVCLLLHLHLLSHCVDTPFVPLLGPLVAFILCQISDSENFIICRSSRLLQGGAILQGIETGLEVWLFAADDSLECSLHQAHERRLCLNGGRVACACQHGFIRLRRAHMRLLPLAPLARHSYSRDNGSSGHSRHNACCHDGACVGTWTSSGPLLFRF